MDDKKAEARDIDELAEQRMFKDIVEQTSHGLVVFRLEDPNDLGSFRMLYANPAASEASRTLMDRFVGTTIAVSFPDLPGELLRAYEETIRTGQSRDLGEIRYGDENIPESIFSITAAPVGDYCVAVFYENVTELNRVELERSEAQEALREAGVESQRLADESAIVAEIGRIITSSLDIREVYEGFAEEVRKLIPFDRISISLYNADEDSLTNAYVVGVRVSGRDPGDVFPASDTVTEEAIRTRSSMIIQGDPDVLKERYPSLEPTGMRSIVMALLMDKNEIIGILHLRSLLEDVYSQRDLALLNRVAAQIAPAIVNSQLFAERRRAEEELLERAAKLASSNAELEQYAYVASHDLQEPLRVIAGFVQLLADRYQGKLDDDADEFIGYAVDGAHRMQTLIDDLLEYSRVGTEGKPLKPTDGNAALDQAISDLHAAIQDGDAKVTCDKLPSVYGDPTQLAHLFQNLIGNAIKFRGDDPPRIHVSSRSNDEDLVVSVADNGIGIASQHREQIFGMFKRLHGEGKYPGNGIGLAICNKIVERHGGRIWVESEVNKGSTFHFTLRIVGMEQ